MEQVLEANPLKFSLQLDRPISPSSDCDARYVIENQSMVVPANPVMAAAAGTFEKREQSWFAMSHVPTDLSIQVQEITFHVHQYPLVSRCAYFSRIELQPTSTGLSFDIKLENFPGGSETFENILKFCYGLPISLTPNNVATLRCAAEFLEMTEALEDGNLIAKAEAFFTFVVLSSWRDSITVLKSCETLSPWAENLQIVRRCCDSIAWKISRETSAAEEVINEQKWWFDEMATLKTGHFTRIITALRAKGMEPRLIGACIMRYAEKWLPTMESETEGGGMFSYGGRNELQWNITSGRRQDGDVEHVKEHRTIVESLVSIVPPQKEAVSCKFLLKMLKMAILYSASSALISELEQRVGLVLDSANVSDLLIPNTPAGNQGKLASANEGQTMHNVDVVQRLLEYFFLYEQQQQHKTEYSAISKLLDSYLAEIARDPKLSVAKFQFLAQSLPENARTCDDGLYRAIDTYLKTHPALSEHEQRRLCRVMDCGKLSLDAYAHAAQNDRLPLKTMIQVLFSEQVKIRATMQGKIHAGTGDNSVEEANGSSTLEEVKALKLELEKVKMQIAEMQRDYSGLQNECERKNIKKERRSSGWALGWRKIRKSALFNMKIDGEETDESHNSINPSRRGSFRRRQSIS